MTARDMCIAMMGAAVTLAVDRLVDGRPFWSAGYAGIAFLLYVSLPKAA